MTSPMIQISTQHLGAYVALTLACLFTPFAAQGDVVVVANPGSSLSSLTKEQVADVFTGKATNLPGVGSVQLIDQPESSPLRDHFYSKVVGKSPSQVRSAWAKLSFTGKGTPPKEGANADEIKKQVAGNKNMLGYIDKAAVDASVKVVFSAP